MTWREFFQNDTPLYVNERHKMLHSKGIARDYLRLFQTLSLGSQSVILDYGCGEALCTHELTSACEHIWLYDPSSLVQERLREQYKDHTTIKIITSTELDALPPHSLDMVLITSVIQYLDAPSLSQALSVIHRLLKPSGHLVIADVILPHAGMLPDLKALLQFAWQGGFFIAAFVGLVRTYFSDYRALREKYGLSCYSVEALTNVLKEHAFEAKIYSPNIGHNSSRMTYVAKKLPS
jgi:ubiquinone/menaquinone biosynthesis C-methylase UbiE